jgi:hypothetical protein
MDSPFAASDEKPLGDGYRHDYGNRRKRRKSNHR